MGPQEGDGILVDGGGGDGRQTLRPRRQNRLAPHRDVPAQRIVHLEPLLRFASNWEGEGSGVTSMPQETSKPGGKFVSLHCPVGLKYSRPRMAFPLLHSWIFSMNTCPSTIMPGRTKRRVEGGDNLVDVLEGVDAEGGLGGGVGEVGGAGAAVEDGVQDGVLRGHLELDREVETRLSHIRVLAKQSGCPSHSHEMEAVKTNLD